MGIRKKVKNTLQSDFFRNVFTLLSGSVVSQLILFLVFLLLPKIYNQAELGVFFLFTSTVFTLSVFSTLRYYLSIVLSTSNKEAINSFVLSVIVSLIVCFFLFFFFIFFGERIKIIFNLKELDFWLYLVPVSIFINGLLDSLNAFFSRNKQYRYCSFAKVTASLSVSGLQVGLGFSILKKIGLIFGHILGNFIGCVFFFYFFINEYRKLFTFVSYKKILILAKRYKKMPLFNSLQGFCNVLSNQLPVFMFASFYGIEYVALYGVANKIITVPVGFITRSVSEVFYREASDKFNRKEDLEPYIKSIYKKLFFIAIIPFTIAFLMAPWGCRFFFGESYYLAGQITRILIPWLFMMFVSSPVSYIPTIFNKQNYLFYLELLLILLRFISILIGYYIYHSLLISVALFSFSGFIYNIFIMYFYLRIARLK